MKIIYHCYGGSHSSVTAASLHLGLIPEDKLPSNEELSKLPYYDGQTKKDHGVLRFIGIDQYDNEVYIVGRRSQGRLLENMFNGLLEVFDIPQNEIYMVNVMPYVNWHMVVGGFTSRALGWIKIGRPIVMKGTKEAFLYIVSLVQKVKMLIASNNKKR